MEIIERPFDDCFLLKPFIIEDERGYFFESFNTQKFKDVTGISTNFVQDNQSYSSYGVIRGLHAQANEFAQRSEEHTSELQSLMRISYAVFCLQKKQTQN